MPELPEVETLCRQLNEILPGEEILTVEVLDPLLGMTEGEGLAGRKIERVYRQGKYIRIEMGKGDRHPGISEPEKGRRKNKQRSPDDRLTAALHDTERFGRQLILQLTELEANRAAAPPSADVAELTRRNAELAADLEAARWTISSLEANVGDSPTPPPASGQRRDEIPPAEPHVSSGAD